MVEVAAHLNDRGLPRSVSWPWLSGTRGRPGRASLTAPGERAPRHNRGTGDVVAYVTFPGAAGGARTIGVPPEEAPC
jgi:hypothetical protein